MEIEVNDIDNNSMKEFTKTLFALKGMVSQFSEEKNLWLVSAGQIVNAHKDIQSSSTKFKEQVEKSTKHIEYVVAVEMRKVSKGLVEEIAGNITSVIEDKTNDSIKKSAELMIEHEEKLERLRDSFEKKLATSSKLINRFSKLFLVATISATIIGGFAGGFVVHYLFPKMDKEVISRLNRSVTFSDFMRLVDEKERQQAALSQK